MFEVDDLIPISSLQHVLYCDRQFALIHVEQVWSENRFTVEGAFLHARVDVPHRESRKKFKQEYALHVSSLQLGLVGICDLVEIKFDDYKHILSAVPVEFKRGRSKPTHVDLVQLCAQALCLSEMLSLPVPSGQIYYLQEHRRTDISFEADLIEETKDLIIRCRKILSCNLTPLAKFSSKKCNNCSLIDLCIPEHIGSGEKNVSRYVSNQVTKNKKGDAE